jgi:hypothetical protein
MKIRVYDMYWYSILFIILVTPVRDWGWLHALGSLICLQISALIFHFIAQKWMDK